MRRGRSGSRSRTCTARPRSRPFSARGRRVAQGAQSTSCACASATCPQSPSLSGVAEARPDPARPGGTGIAMLSRAPDERGDDPGACAHIRVWVLFLCVRYRRMLVESGRVRSFGSCDRRLRASSLDSQPLNLNPSVPARRARRNPRVLVLIEQSRMNASVSSERGRIQYHDCTYGYSIHESTSNIC